MNYIEAPSNYSIGHLYNTLFIAGGITDCPDWQSEIVSLLSETSFSIFNPRRENFPIGDPDAAFEQIGWEHKALRDADRISFWFPKETICPIVLYELGAWSMMKKPIFVGVHPEYQRKQDVEIQTKLARPEVDIVYSLEELSEQLISIDISGYYKKNSIIKATQQHQPFKVDTLEGIMSGKAGDYLVTDVDGERYPVDKEIFEKTYDKVSELEYLDQKRSK